MTRRYDALFLCTGNSARSLMAEAILNRLGAPRIRGHSAGSHPKERPHPMTLEVLSERGHPISGLRSKGWDEFVQPGAPRFDFVFTVCDATAGEACPVWPGQPLRAHWGVEDPAAFAGAEDQQRALFRRVYAELHRRIGLFVELDLSSLHPRALKSRLDDIGRVEVPAAETT